MFECVNIFFRFWLFFLQTFVVSQVPGPNWGFLSDVGMFHFGRGLLVCFNLVDWKTHFSILQGLLECFNIFFRFCCVFLQTFDVFQLLGPTWGFLSNVGMFDFGWSLLLHFYLVDWSCFNFFRMAICVFFCHKT